jgi:hypothetical protein
LVRNNFNFNFNYYCPSFIFYFYPLPVHVKEFCASHLANRTYSDDLDSTFQYENRGSLFLYQFSVR